MTARRMSSTSLAYVTAVIWILLTVSLATWWLIFGLDQARRLRELGGEAERLGHVQRMLTWEGATLIVLLLLGGLGLVVAIRRERARRREVQEFFMAFTHDLKTSLASLRLQVEALQEDTEDETATAHYDRLLKDTLRLELQLENSLFFAHSSDGLLPEAVPMRALILEVAADWPEIAVAVAGDATVRADRRALGSVLRNVLQNAAIHGEATSVDVAVARANRRATVVLRDNGRGAPPGLVAPARQPFARPSATSGTGMGLFVSERLIVRMGGSLACRSAPGAGFTVEIALPEAA
jgi:signal transduction histidine kinase